MQEYPQNFKPAWRYNNNNPLIRSDLISNVIYLISI